MNKHKKFIKDAYDGKYGSMCQYCKDTILEYYPEFKKEEFKVGDWVYWSGHNPTVGRIKSENRHDGRENYILSETIERKSPEAYTSCHISNLRKATPKEVREHLIAEAERRGYLGAIVNSGLSDSTPKRYLKLEDTGFRYYMKDDELWIDEVKFPYYRVCIYKKGQWAEIINTMTKEEAEEKLGCKII